MAIRAVAFDVDGTLYPFRHLVLRAAALALTDLRRTRLFWRVRRSVRALRPIEDFRLLQARLFAEAAAVGLEEARAWIDGRIYGEWVRSFRAIRPHRGLREFLEGLGRRGIRCAVLSDFPVEEKLRYLGLAECFTVALCSEESGYLKPNPEPFALLCDTLGLEPAEILYVGDSYERDIVGAGAAGLRTAHLACRTAPRSVADVVFSRYRELEGSLEALGMLPDADPSPTGRN